ncbi:hypothetical protein R1flu_013881 [Riccia fluitans]|uniref:Uncharacterized protein n=1 Tax=Riccia fluitans TaxID=41844 RepID=A0ABD1YEU1_9MARC
MRNRFNSRGEKLVFCPLGFETEAGRDGRRLQETRKNWREKYRGELWRKPRVPVLEEHVALNIINPVALEWKKKWEEVLKSYFIAREALARVGAGASALNIS